MGNVNGDRMTTDLRKRLGMIRIPLDIVNKDPKLAWWILQKLEFVPIDAKIGHGGRVEYLGYSKKFRLLQEGEEYHIYALHIDGEELSSNMVGRFCLGCSDLEHNSVATCASSVEQIIELREKIGNSEMSEVKKVK